jgi:heme exporter protein D
MIWLIVSVAILGLVQMVFLILFVLAQRKRAIEDMDRAKREKNRMLMDGAFVLISLISLAVDGANRVKKAKT